MVSSVAHIVAEVRPICPDVSAENGFLRRREVVCSTVELDPGELFGLVRPLFDLRFAAEALVIALDGRSLRRRRDCLHIALILKSINFI